MSEIEKNEPAFPLAIGQRQTGPHEFEYDVSDGMTIRQYYAAKALQGLCANPAVFAANPRSGWALVNAGESDLAVYCMSLADELIKAGQS